MKIVTFFTDKYERFACTLVDSATKFGYEVVEERIEETGDWQCNTDKKALIVNKHLVEGKPFIITDADSEIVAPIDFSFFDGCDFSARLKGGVEMLSGTMYFKPSPAVYQMVGNWIYRNSVDRTRLEQQHLHEAYKESNVDFKEMPSKYCAIFDERPPVPDPCVLHYQASRAYRRKLNAGRV